MNAITQTSRLSLRELYLEGDIDFIAGLLADPEVMHYWPNPMSRTEAIQWIEKQLKRYADFGCGYWLVIDKETDQPIGQAGVLMTEVDSVLEAALGYMIHRPYWGQGYATEAAVACSGFVVEKLNRSRVITLIRPENQASLRVAEKIGMTPERATQFAGYEHVIYTVTRDLKA